MGKLRWKKFEAPAYSYCGPPASSTELFEQDNKNNLVYQKLIWLKTMNIT